MGLYQYIDPQTGKAYELEHAGDAPTDEDFAVLAGVLRQDRTQIAQEYESRFGEAPEAFDDGTALGRGYERGKKQVKQAFGETLGTAGEQSGLGFLANYGQGLEERARQELGELQLEQPERMQSTDVEGFGSGLTYAGEIAGEQITQLGLGLGAAVAAPILAGATGVAAPFVIGAGAAALVSAPILFGNNIQRQEDEVAAGTKLSVDVGDALTATFGQALLEGVSDKLLLGGALPKIGKSLFVRTTARFGGGATTEGLTEVGQQMMERAQAGLEVDSDEAIAEYREAAIAGGLIGGGVRATGFGERSEITPVVPEIILTPEEEAAAAVEAQANELVADDVAAAEPVAPADPTELTPAQEAVVAEEGPQAEAIVKVAKAKVAEYSAEPAVEPTVELNAQQKFDQAQAKFLAKQVVTEEMLTDLGISKNSPLRKAKARKIVGLPITDPKVKEQLDTYVKTSGAPAKTIAKVDALLGGADAGLGITPTDINAGLGDGVQGRGPSLEQLEPADGTSGDTTGVAPPVTGPVGDNLRDVSGDAIPTGLGADTLEASQVDDPTRNKATAERLVAAANAKRAVEALEQEVDAIVTEPITQEPVAPQPQGTPEATPAMVQAAAPGQVTETAGQVIPPAIPPAPRVAPAQVRGASIPQADLQAVDDARSAVAQAQLDSTFENNRGKQPEIREYHDSQLDPRDTPEVTTAVDKEGIVELINTKDADLGVTAKAAKLYFKRFRRPVDALAEMGAVSAVGPTQSIERDYTPAQFSFYKGMTNKSAMNAGKWVRSNMSPQAMAVIVDAAALARQDTAKFSPSDAYIGVTKAMKGIQEKEDTAFAKQMNRELASLELQAKEPAALGQEMRGEGPVGAIKPIKGQTAFDSYMLGMGFKKRKVPNKDEYNYFDPENDNRVLTPEEVQEYYDGLAYTQNELGFLLIDPVHGLNQALLPSIRNALQRGDLQFALNAIAATSQVDRIRQIAAKLAGVVGTTKVQVVDDISPLAGRKAAGMFAPKTNTIYIDAANGMNVHTVLHEMTHATTSASLANPLLPETMQLKNLLTAVRKELGDVYGTRSLDEFVAEAFSNPEFQSALALLKLDNGKMSGWEKFTSAVRNIVRKLIGLRPKNQTSVLDQVDSIINGMLAPSPATRSAPSILLESGTSEGSLNIAGSTVEAVPTSKRAEYVEMAADVVYNSGEPALRGVKNIILGSLDSRILADVAKKKIPFAPQLNIMIRKMSGAMRKRTDALDAMVGNYAAWARKADNKAAVKILNNIIPKSTALKVDPSLLRGFYSSYKTAYHDLVTKKSVVKEFSTEQARTAWVQNFNAKVDAAKTTKAKNMKDPNPQDLEVYDALREQYVSMGTQGQAFYRQMRNFFQDTYDEILPALRTRLEATISDPATRASAFEKLSDILMKESGIIRPYFPLMRKGKHRLQYTALNEKGQPDVIVEYYENRRSLNRAFELAKGVSVAGTQPEYTRADQPMNFNAVPSSSFVYDILKQMEFSKNNFRDKNGNLDNKAYEAAVQGVVDLALDAMPERSLMQGFRRRKNVRGYIGDMTPTKIGDTEFDAITMMKGKGRDLNRQIVQIQSAAEIEKFRIQLKDGGYLSNPETAEIARKLDQIAAFAQKPNVPRWSQVANGVGFNLTMGLNFSSAAITFFDVAMSAMPIISAEYGVVETAAAYRAAIKLMANAPKTRGIMVSGPDGVPIEQEVKMGVIGKAIFNYTPDQLPPEMQAVRADILIDMASDQGQANQSMTQESLEVGRDAPLEGINKWSSAMFHHSERFNRETTLTAAYMLEVKKLQVGGRQLTDQQYKDAAQKAIDTTEFTLGSTAAAGRPVWAQSGIGNVAFLFKRFAIAKYYMMYKLGIDSIGSTNIQTIMQEQGVTQEQAQQIVAERKIARLGLRNFLISTGVMAGAGGMPLMGALGAIYNMFADDDEDDFESALRKYIGEGIYGGLANEVLGIDVASRISLNSLLYRPPFIEKDQSPIFTFVEQLGGPLVGLTNNALRGGAEVIDGLKTSNSDAIRRGSETVMPAFLRNISKGFRFYNEGATTRRGDPVTEDISLYNALMQASGFAPEAYVRELEYNRNVMRRKKTVEERRSKLNKRHNMAQMVGDRSEMRKIRAMMDEFNVSLPKGAEDRRITNATRESSYKAFVTNSGKSRGGVMHTPFMDKIRDEFNQ